MPVLFTANDVTHGEELWATDGSQASLFKDFIPGANAGAPSAMTVIDGVGYFVATDGATGYFGPTAVLWRTDGTTAGTISLGVVAGYADTPPLLAQMGGKIYYIGFDASHQWALYATDGQSQGQLVKSLTGPVYSLDAVGGHLLMDVSQNHMWTSDGTAAGTHALDLGSGGTNLLVSPPLVANGKGYFTTSNGLTVAAWQTDGVTASPVSFPAVWAGLNVGLAAAFDGRLVVVTNNPRGGGGEIALWDGIHDPVVLQQSTTSAPTSAIVQDGKLYFSSWNDSAPNTTAAGLYVSDGTPGGTKEIAAGAFNHFVQIGSHYVLEDATAVYVTDGTSGVPTVVTTGFLSDPIVRAGNKVYFTVATSNGSALWVSDGTAAGSHLVETGLSARNVTAFGDKILFTGATDGVNFEPWTSDGTAGGTHQIADIKPISPGNIGAQDAIAFGSKTAFIDGTGRAFVTDGTAAGTGALVSSPYSYAVQPDLTVAGGKLFFEVSTANGPQLYVSSGVPGDAHAVSILSGSGPASMFTVLNGKLYFYDATVTGAGLGSGGLYVTDGTDVGTHQVAAIQVLVQPLIAGGELIFAGANASASGIFASIGGAGAGAVKIADATWNGGGIVAGGKAYFRAWDQVNGDELWVSDGTAAGTHVTKDIALGLDTSSASIPVAFGSGVVFTADDGLHGREVWSSDGSAAGTYMVADINATGNTAAALNLNPATSIYPPSGVSFNGKYAFVADDGVHGPQIWTSDGVAGDTRLTSFSAPVNGGTPHGLATLGVSLFFFDSAGAPWISDGTTAGTHALGNQVMRAGQATVLLDGKLYFVAEITTGGGGFAAGLFATDGAGVTQVAASATEGGLALVAVGHNLYYFQSGHLTAFDTLTSTTTTITSANVSAELVQDDELYYLAAINGQTGVGLYKTNGFPGGTSLVKTVSGQTGFATSYLAAGTGGFFFTPFAVNFGGGPPTLWFSDGTTAGTVQITLPTTADVVTYLQQLTPDGSKLYFVERFLDAPAQLLVYDQVAHTTTVVHTVSDGLLPPTVANGVLYFSADDAFGNEQLWRDGLSGPTMLTSASNGQGPFDLMALGSKVVFLGSDTQHPRGLYVSDGTVAGTVFLANIDPNLTVLPSTTVINGKLYFQGYDATNGDELWVTDGTVAGTHRVSDTVIPNSSNANGFTVVGGHILFEADDGVHGNELWSFDGTPGSAKLLADINPGLVGSNPTYFTSMGGALYFVANPGSGFLLYRSDGTAAGTKPISTPASGGAPQVLTAVGNELFFFGFDPTHGTGLFVTDGTTAGIQFLRAFTSVSDIVVSGGKLMFEGADPINGVEFWSSDGTAAGTVKVTATGVDSGSNPTGFTDIGDYHAGTAGADIFHAGPGDGVYDGLAGNDFLVLAGAARAYTIGATAGAGVVAGGPESGNNQVTSIENLVFGDGVLTFDQNNAAAVVMRMYDTTFGRAPDVLGGQYWTHLYESGQVSLSDMAVDFASSTEFQNDVKGLSQRQVVDFMYENTLHRPADQAGEDTWTAYLQQGHSLGELVLQFSESAEHKALTSGQVAAGLWDGDANAQVVEFMYEAAFGRAPDAGGLTTWVGALRGGLSLHDMAVDFTSSGEFFNNTQGLTHRQLVDYMYQTALHRAADPTGETSWTIFLDNGGSPADLLLQFEQSQELQLANASHIDHGVWFT